MIDKHLVSRQGRVIVEAAVKRFGPPLLQAAGAVVGKIAGIGFGMLGFAVSVLIAGFLFVPGPRLAEAIKTFARRIAAERGAHFVDLAGATIRNISRGVIGVALLQALLTGLILTLFGVPGAGVIAFLVLIFCIVQVGPVPVVLPVIIWAWSTKDTGPALLLTLLLIVIPVIDNVLKPILMARGLSTPMLVILLGVIGGTVSYGLIGLFLGPILLGIFYELLMAWVKTKRQPKRRKWSDGNGQNAGASTPPSLRYRRVAQALRPMAATRLGNHRRVRVVMFASMGELPGVGATGPTALARALTVVDVGCTAPCGATRYARHADRGERTSDHGPGLRDRAWQPRHNPCAQLEHRQANGQNKGEPPEALAGSFHCSPPVVKCPGSSDIFVRSSSGSIFVTPAGTSKTNESAATWSPKRQFLVWIVY